MTGQESLYYLVTEGFIKIEVSKASTGDYNIFVDIPPYMHDIEYTVINGRVTLFSQTASYDFLTIDAKSKEHRDKFCTLKKK